MAEYSIRHHKNVPTNILRIRRWKQRTSPGPLFQTQHTITCQPMDDTLHRKVSCEDSSINNIRKERLAASPFKKSRSNIRFPFQLRPNIPNLRGEFQHLGTCVSFPQYLAINLISSHRKCYFPLSACTRSELQD